MGAKYSVEAATEQEAIGIYTDENSEAARTERDLPKPKPRSIGWLIAALTDQQPTGATTSAVIDLGGGALGSDGRNCIFGGAIYDLEATRYNVSAENNWWGRARGPLLGKVVETVPGYKIDTSSPLRRAPPACNGEEPSR